MTHLAHPRPFLTEKLADFSSAQRRVVLRDFGSTASGVDHERVHGSFWGAIAVQPLLQDLLIFVEVFCGSENQKKKRDRVSAISKSQASSYSKAGNERKPE